MAQQASRKANRKQALLYTEHYCPPYSRNHEQQGGVYRANPAMFCLHPATEGMGPMQGVNNDCDDQKSSSNSV